MRGPRKPGLGDRAVELRVAALAAGVRIAVMVSSRLALPQTTSARASFGSHDADGVLPREVLNPGFVGDSTCGPFKGQLAVEGRDLLARAVPELLA
jgi:hypothetical protein